jgi:hypothetical protein
MLGTKWPSMISTWIQSALLLIVVEQAWPRAAKSADRIDGAMMAGGDMVAGRKGPKEGTMADADRARRDNC